MLSKVFFHIWLELVLRINYPHGIHNMASNKPYGEVLNQEIGSLYKTKGNGNSKSKGFLKHDYFVCKPAQFTFRIKKQHFGVQRFKTIKREKNQNELTCIYLILICVFNFLGLKPIVIQTFIHS